MKSVFLSPVVCNAGPLIGLARINREELNYLRSWENSSAISVRDAVAGVEKETFIHYFQEVATAPSPSP